MAKKIENRLHIKSPKNSRVNPGAWVEMRISTADALRIATMGHPYLLPFKTVIEADGIKESMQKGSTNREVPEDAALFVHEEVRGKKILDILAPEESVINKLPQRGSLEFVLLIFQIFDAVDSLHNSYHFDEFGNIVKDSLIHRDIGPHNLLFYGGNLRLFDYELACFEGEYASYHPSGNVSFSPKEAYYFEEPATAQADIFSLGWTIFDLIYSENELELSSRLFRIACNSNQMTENSKGVPQGVVDVLKKASSYFPEDRYPSVAVFWHEFKSSYEKAYKLQIPSTKFSSDHRIKQLVSQRRIRRTIEPE